MVNYSTSPIAALAAGPGTPVNPGYIPVNQSMNVRDALSGFIGKGFTDLKNEDARNVFSYLRGYVGPDAARRLITHALMFNQRSDMAGVSPEQKVQSFYSIPSADPLVNNMLARSGAIGHGPVEGLRTSPDILNMQASGRKQFIDRPVTASKDIDKLGAGADLIQRRGEALRR